MANQTMVEIFSRKRYEKKTIRLAAIPIDVDVPRQAPSYHLQVVEADHSLEQVVAVLIVNL